MSDNPTPNTLLKCRSCNVHTEYLCVHCRVPLCPEIICRIRHEKDFCAGKAPPPAPRISEEEIQRVTYKIWREASTLAEIAAILRTLNESRKA